MTYIIGFLFGVATLVFAIKRGRSPLWFFAGLFFNFFGLAVLLILPDRSGVQRQPFANPEQPFTRPTQPVERSDDYVPQVMKEDNYKANSVDVGFEIVEDDK